MHNDGTSAWPSQDTLAERTGLAVRVVRRHLAIADNTGWVLRTLKRRSGGKNWKYTVYQAVIPVAVCQLLPERPWEADPQWRRDEAVDDWIDEPPKVRTGDAEVRTGLTEGADTACTKVRTPSPTNSSSNSSYNSSTEGALTRTPTMGLPHEEEEEDRKARIREFIAKPQRRQVYPTPEMMARVVPLDLRFTGYDRFIEEVWRETEAA